MTSGVRFDEDYLDFNSDINKTGRILVLGGSMDDFAAELAERFATPGQTWKYISIDTHVIGMMIRGATGRDIPELLSEKIFVPLQLEATPYYLTDGRGVSFVLGGLNMTTRDYARFALMVLQDGKASGQQIVRAVWLGEAPRASASTKPGEIGYGYQWWIPKGAQPGEFMARGIYGQYMYINKSHDLVIVATAADRAFRTPGVDDRTVALFRAIAAAL